MLERQAPRFVSAAEITRNFGMWQDRTAQGPLIVTHHGRPRCVLVSATAWQQMASIEPVSDDERALIEHDLLAERIDSGFVALDGDLMIRGANALGAMMLGHARDTLVGLSFAEAMPVLADGPVGGQLRRTLRSGEDGRLIAPHGGGKLRVHVFPWPDGVALTLRPAGEEDEADHAERTAVALREAIEAHGAIGTAQISMRGTIKTADAGFARMAGFTAGRLVGVRATDLLALSARTKVSEAMEDVLSGKGARSVDSRLLVNGAEERPVHIAIAPIVEGYGTSGAVIVLS
ncbi:type II toxin-antitoxin system Phd/YefM family antitoxin [Sphingomonas sp. CGMCC 1.13654]|uniref:Type II toxin-antitoxin system Phd/YefM family antitoxin n=2 Tax=Sphingomonas chungangi TaxID=2683589 RepID=A0A838L6J9_9SPHN|nr:type II toxin-antitoxin system Phd/YefM family antitoxin [Sphingomonas chungangi]